MRRWLALGLFLGLGAVVVLAAWQGFATVAQALAALGWGLALLPLAFLPHLVLAALSWRLLFRRGRAPRFAVALRAMWIGLSVDTLLPLASIGGEVAKLRVLVQAGVGGTDAGASVVVDKTVQAVSILLWGFVGVALLLAAEVDGRVVGAAFLVLALLGLGIAGFVWAQVAGSFGALARLFARVAPARLGAGLAGDATRLDATIRAHLLSRRRLTLACALRLAARLTLTVEIWLAAALMGHGLTLFEALLLKSLTGALRGVVFVVPGALGIQEGGYVALGLLLGLSPEPMLALSLATRARELLVSLPGLLAWQRLERRAG